MTMCDIAKAKLQTVRTKEELSDFTSKLEDIYMSTNRITKDEYGSLIKLISEKKKRMDESDNA